MELAAIPFPRDDTTPPVTKMKRVRVWAGGVMRTFRSSLEAEKLSRLPDGSGKSQNAVGDGLGVLLGQPVGPVDPLDLEVVGVVLAAGQGGLGDHRVVAADQHPRRHGQAPA